MVKLLIPRSPERFNRRRLGVLPPLYTTENTTDPVVMVKFFHPRSAWTWYALEFDGDNLFFGIVDGFVREHGYFTLCELESFRDSVGVGIEFDEWFEPCRVSELPPFSPPPPE